VLGALAVVTVVEEATGGDALANFAGLSRRAPGLSLCLLVFLLSWPAFHRCGLHWEFFVFSAGGGRGCRSSGLLWLVILAILMSAVSFYYYLRVLKQAYVLDAVKMRPPSGSTGHDVALVLLALLVVLLGVLRGF